MAVEITRSDLTAAQVRLAAGRTKGCSGGAADAGDRAGHWRAATGKSAAETCGMDRPDAARLGGPPRCRRGGGPDEPAVARPPAPPRSRAEGGARSMGASRSRSRARRARARRARARRARARRGGALAADRPEAAHRGGIRRRDARAQRGQAAAGARPAPPGATAEAPEGRPRRPRGVQRNVRDAVAATIPEPARDKPVEAWFQSLPRT